MCSTAASSFGREGISVATGWGSHGEARGCAVSSTMAEYHRIVTRWFHKFLFLLFRV
jgi:hypothetical protein